MSKEIIINSDQKQTRIAIVENGKLAELFIETKEVERTIGNLFLGRVRRIMPSIQAAFIDIGQKQDAFLHFSDLVDNIPDWLKFIQQENPKISSFKAEFARQPIKGRRSKSRNTNEPAGKEKENSDYDVERIEPAKSSGGSRRNNGSRGTSDGGEINPVNYLKRDAPILVRISKEPIQSKGSRITTDVSLAGRFLVLVPLAGYVAVSKKIASYKERRRLKALAKSLVPEGFGVIVRTVAEGRNAKALDTDLRLLIEKWDKVEERLAERPEIPCEIHEDVNMASSIIRDFFSEDFDRIVIDNDRLFRNIKGYVQAVAPKMASKVQMHKGARPLFEAMKIEKAVEQAFSNRVDLPSGGYLFIEQTEAMHVIDVNSGRAGRGLSQEENSTRVNLESATLIAEQVRLRDLGGIIVVDFIDMRQPKNRRKVYDHLRREFRKDRAVTKVLQMSDFGLIQITRQRLRPSITHTFAIDGQVAGSATGGGAPLHIERASYETVEPDDLVGKIDDWLSGFREAGRKGPVKLIVHPFTASYLNRRIPGQSFRWYMKYRIRVRIDADEHIDPLSFRFVDLKAGKGKTTSPMVPETGTGKDEAGAPKKRQANRSGEKTSRRGTAASAGSRRSGGARKPKTASSSRSSGGSRVSKTTGSSRSSGDTRRSGSPQGASRTVDDSRKSENPRGSSRKTNSGGSKRNAPRRDSNRSQSSDAANANRKANATTEKSIVDEQNTESSRSASSRDPIVESTAKKERAQETVVLKSDSKKAEMTPSPEESGKASTKGHKYKVDLRSGKGN